MTPSVGPFVHSFFLHPTCALPESPPGHSRTAFSQSLNFFTVSPPFPRPPAHAVAQAIDVSPPRQIVAHGWWTKNRQKISKSLGNTIDLDEVRPRASDEART